MTNEELELKKIKALEQIAIELSNLSSQLKDVKKVLQNISNKDSSYENPKFRYLDN